MGAVRPGSADMIAAIGDRPAVTLISKSTNLPSAPAAVDGYAVQADA